MMLKISNTLSKKKEVLKPRVKGNISLFVCGPTVYDFSHLGHARTYIAFDIIVKYLKTQGFNVFYLQNITDLDDKIIQRAKESAITPFQLSRKFEKEYLKDMKSIGVDSVTHYAKATDHIKKIISQIERLMKKQYAYELREDGIYYDISKFKKYGKLSKRTSLQAEDSVSRIDESVNKKNRGDFVLWKFKKENAAPEGGEPRPDGREPSWKSPWGEGRPGWHIEDTSITEYYFGPQYDLHGGAVDLIFPHHEAERAQQEAASGLSPFVKIWMHSGFLNIDFAKMSKSTGNFMTAREFLKTYSANAFRMMVAGHHYRSPLAFSPDVVTQAENTLDGLGQFLAKLDPAQGRESGPDLKKAEDEFLAAMNDDFNAPAALASFFIVVNGVQPKIFSLNKKY